MVAVKYSATSSPLEGELKNPSAVYLNMAKSKIQKDLTWRGEEDWN